MCLVPAIANSYAAAAAAATSTLPRLIARWQAYFIPPVPRGNPNAPGGALLPPTVLLHCQDPSSSYAGTVVANCYCCCSDSLRICSNIHSFHIYICAHTSSFQAIFRRTYAKIYIHKDMFCCSSVQCSSACFQAFRDVPKMLLHRATDGW